jgi:DNA modification methylase
MEVNKIYQGTCLDVIKTFADKSVDCVITSPPYWQLRDYGWDGQWGNEPTFQMYLENLWSLMDEVWRVLKDTGTVWVNLGDSYMPHGGTRGNSTVAGSDTLRGNNNLIETAPMTKRDMSGIKAKSLVLIPHRFAIGCIDRGWIMRNDIVWAKRNGMPESVTDRFSKKHEYFFFMTKSEKYYFDLDIIRDNHVSNNKIKILKRGTQDWNDGLNRPQNSGSGGIGRNDLGKNPGTVSDFWDINTKPSKESHYASYNTQLIDKPIIAGCPIDGIILDPFCGTATTGCRAIDLQRKFIGIEGKKEYVDIGNKKLHPFLITQQLF